LRRLGQYLSGEVYSTQLVNLQFLVQFSRFAQAFYLCKILILVIQYMAKLFHMPIFQEKWFRRALAHVFAVYEANSKDIPTVIKLLCPKLNQPTEYKRKLS
jgi:hypothetical protein